MVNQYYLIQSDTYGCVEYNILVGIAQGKMGLYEVLNNYFKMMNMVDKKYNVESDINELLIYEITEKSFDQLNEIYDSCCTSINKYLIDEYDFKPIDNYSRYFFTRTSNEHKKQYDIFNKKQHKIYMKIIDISTLII